ncbi:restriction endonuclease subunit S [Stieleria sp. JC731]|uniref:restriction endonuclease subunit S n=1 Tax=Pirellulaceae TaxID=2691357 RepID=UPI001E41A2C9|nr:restriction endonuclease subunit S [Stieleria sp. JC731]MCC9601030.1 restriction endonuclease subunit S [Stieleria sp. JC731]
MYSRLFAFEGAYGLVPVEFDGHFVSNEFPLFECNEERLHYRFLAWFFRRSTTWTEVAQFTTGMGSRRQRIKPEALYNYAIPLPSIDEQIAISERIESIHQKLQQIYAAHHEVDSLSLGLLRSRMSEVTADSEYFPLVNVAPIVRRRVLPKPGETFAELGIRSFGKGTFHKPSLDFMSVGSKKLYRIEAGDLVFSNVFAWEGAIAVAKAKDHGRVGSHRFITCVPKEGLATPQFLCFYLLTPEGMASISDASPGGAGRNRTLGLKKLEKIKVPIPEMAEQQRFGTLLKRIRSAHRERTKAKANLDAMMPSILDRAFKGEL